MRTDGNKETFESICACELCLRKTAMAGQPFKYKGGENLLNYRKYRTIDTRTGKTGNEKAANEKPQNKAKEKTAMTI
jgi:hypothetical protein